MSPSAHPICISIIYATPSRIHYPPHTNVRSIVKITLEAATVCTCYSITRVSSSAATYARASASQDIARVSPPSRVRTGSRTHIPTGTPSRSTVCRDTTDTFRTQHRPPAPPADVGDGGAAAEQLARAVMWTASVQATTANTTIQGT